MTDEPAATDQPFSSLAEVQETHLALRHALDPFETPEAAAAQDRHAVVVLRHRIRRFEQRAAAAGQFLDDRSDRDLVQSLLDYWSIRQSYLVAQAGRLRATAQGDRTRRAPVLPEALILAPFDETSAPMLADDQSPFIGLNAFAETDAGKANFQGRSEAVRELIALMATNRLVVVTGSSGSGKSSLVMAGLVPALRGGALPDSAGWRYWPAVLPGTDPVAALLGALRPAGTDPADWMAQWRTALETAPARLPEVVAAAGGGPSLLVVDQTEELLTLTMAQPAREAFLAAVLALVTAPDPLHRVILVIREDFLSRLQDVKPMTGFPHDAIAVYRPRPMTAGELRMAIEEPARAVALKFDPGVVDDLVREVAGDPAALPLLQFTLTQLWQRRRRNRITRESYEEVGSPSDALERTAERVYAGLRTQEAQDAAHAIFLALVVPAFATGVIPGGGADGVMIGSEWVRRRVRRETLHNLRDSTRIDRVLDTFVAAGLIRMTAGSERDEDRFDVMHEALLRNWRRLSGWLVEQRRDSEKQLQVLTAARQWNNAGQHADRLAVGEALAEARLYAGGDPLIAQYVEASTRAASAGRIARRRSIGAFAITVLALAGMAVAWMMVRVDATQQSAEVAELTDRVRQESREIVREEAAQAVAPAAALPSVKQDGPGVTGYVWTGNAAQPLIRDAVTGKVVDPADVREGGRYRMRVNVALRSGWPTDDRYDSPPRLFGDAGTAAAGSLMVAEAVKRYDRPSGWQYWIRARLIPQVFTQYPETGAAGIAAVVEGLRGAGYDVPAPERVPAAASKSEVRFYHAQDQASAARLAGDVSRLIGAAPGRIDVRDMSATRMRAAPGTLELWLDPGTGHGG